MGGWDKRLEGACTTSPPDRVDLGFLVLMLTACAYFGMHSTEGDRGEVDGIVGACSPASPALKIWGAAGRQ